MTQTPITISLLPDLGAAQGTDRAAVDRLGTPISAGAFVVGQAYQIVTVGNTNFTTIGAESNTVGTYFVATGVGTGSGTAAPINTGDVALNAVAALVTKTSLGLDQVDNTSDEDKPVSTDTQAALNTKANAGVIGSSGLTMGPGILLRETGTGAPQVYSLGSGLSIVGGALVVTSGGSGTVTSVGLSVPTGFAVTGSPVIASGTLALGFALGYSLPTDARQNDWDTAFNQRRTWDGGSQHLDAAVGRASLELGTAAQSPTTAFISATATQSANVVLAGPATGSAAAPTFRALLAADLPATAVTPGAYGSATSVGAFTVDAQGRLTAASNVTINIPIASVTGLGTGVSTALAVNIGTAGAPVILGGAGGTPSSLALINATGLPLTTGVTGILPIANGGTGTATPGLVAGNHITISGTWPNQTITATGGGGGGGGDALTTNPLSQFAATTSAQLRGVISDETGTGLLFFQGGDVGTPSAGVLTNCTGLPLGTGITGLGAGIATALAINAGSPGAPVLLNGAGGTPSSLTLSNATGLPFGAGISGKPTTLAGYGITDAVGSSDARLSDARTPTAHNQAWSTITATPTTLAGYGITDGFTEAQVRATPLTGYASGAGTVAATDSILQAIQKLNGNDAGRATAGAIGSSGLTQAAGILGAATAGAPQVYTPLGLAFNGANLATLADLIIPLSDETTALTASSIVARVTIPYWPRATTLTDPWIWAVATAPTGAALQFDIQVGGTSIYLPASGGTYPTIAAGSTNSTTSAGVFTTAFAAAPTIAAGSSVAFFVRQVGGTAPGTGLKVIAQTRRAG